jgi:hypothetical protein
MSHPLRILATTLLLVAALTTRAGTLIETTDPKGDDIRAAVKSFLTDLADGKEKEARAAFAGDEAATKLLDKYVKAIAASQDFRKAAAARFPDNPDLARGGVDEAIRGYIRAIPVETIIIDDAGGDTASMSPGHGFLLGVDLKRVDGKWKIASPTALHREREKRLAEELDAVCELLPALTEEVASGKLATAEAVMNAGQQRLGERLEAIEKKYAGPTTKSKR